MVAEDIILRPIITEYEVSKVSLVNKNIIILNGLDK